MPLPLPLPRPLHSILTERKMPLHPLGFGCQQQASDDLGCCLPLVRPPVLLQQQPAEANVIANQYLRRPRRELGLKGSMVGVGQLHFRQSGPGYYSSTDSLNILGYQFSLCIALQVQVSPNQHRYIHHISYSSPIETLIPT